MAAKKTPKSKQKYDKKYNARPEQKKRRAARGRARYAAEKAGKVRKGDGKDIDHKDGNPNNNSPSNLRVTSRKHNRSRNNNKGRKGKR